MPGIVRLSKKELDELIESVEAEGGDTTEFKKLQAKFIETQPQKLARRMVLQVGAREEETTEERLNREAGDLFPGGFSADILTMCIEYDGNYTACRSSEQCASRLDLAPAGIRSCLRPNW